MGADISVDIKSKHFLSSLFSLCLSTWNCCHPTSLPALQSCRLFHRIYSYWFISETNLMPCWGTNQSRSTHERLLRASRLTLASQMAFSCLSFLDRVHGFQGSLSIWMQVRDILWSGARHLRDFSFKRTGILDVMGDEQCHKNVVCTSEVHFSQGFV